MEKEGFLFHIYHFSYLLDGTFCKLEVSGGHSIVGLLAGTVCHSQVESGDLMREPLLEGGQVHPLRTVYLHRVCITVCVCMGGGILL